MLDRSSGRSQLQKLGALMEQKPHPNTKTGRRFSAAQEVRAPPCWEEVEAAP